VRSVFSFFVVLSLSLAAFAQSKQADYLLSLESLAVEDMRNAMFAATEHGLNPKDYWTDDMENQFARSGGLNAPLKERTKAAFLRYLQTLNSGLVNPDLVSGDEIKVSKKPFLDNKQFNMVVLTQSSDALTLVNSFAPQNPPYRSLQAALNRMTTLCNANEWPEVSNPKKELKLGSVDPILPQIKTRLRQLGYQIATIDEVYDQQTLQAVNDIQNTVHYRPDGVISPNGRTWRYLNASCIDRIQQIRMDMEKLRWFPRDFGNRYIYVNLAQTYLTLVDKDTNFAMVMKTINGRPTRKSPTLIDKITYVVVNPFWVVPPTVFKEDKLSDLRGLSSGQVQRYFNEHHYEVWSKDFSYRMSPSGINWNWVGGDADFYIRQKPGMHNSLGVLKFMLTNDFAIYLHDTNQRELFTEYERQLSSGCVRVEKPYDLAEYLLQGTAWDRYAIDTKTAQKGEVLNKDTNVTLPKAMPVYMVFQTATLSSDGVIRFAEDSYDQGTRIQRAMYR
jgi:murein L,D-transpeptidase YcbB/YkuD